MAADPREFDAQVARLEDWLADRPAIIGEVARKYPPWGWYHLSTDVEPGASAYRPHSYSEDGTVCLSRYNVATGRAMWQVFGIDPADLVATDDPDTLRARLTADEVEDGCVAFDFAMARLAAAVRSTPRDQETT